MKQFFAIVFGLLISSSILVQHSYAEYTPTESDAKIINSIIEVVGTVAKKDNGHSRLYQVHKKLGPIIEQAKGNERYEFLFSFMDGLIGELFALEGGTSLVQNEYGIFGVAPDTNRFYILDENLYIKHSIYVGSQPTRILLQGKYAYVSNKGSTFVSEIDLQSISKKRDLNVGVNPYDIAIVGDILYATHFDNGSENIAIYDMNNNELLPDIHTNTNSFSISERGLLVSDEKNKKIYYGLESISPANLHRGELDTQGYIIELKKSDHGDLGGSARYLSLSKDGSKAYYLTNTKALQVVDTNTLTRIATANINGFPVDAAITTDESYIYVADSESKIYKISLSTYTIESVLDASTDERAENGHTIHIDSLYIIGNSIVIGYGTGYNGREEIITYVQVPINEFN